jgi:hypothetical protein
VIKKSASRITDLSVQLAGLASQRICTSCQHPHEIARNPFFIVVEFQKLALLPPDAENAKISSAQED